MPDHVIAPNISKPAYPVRHSGTVLVCGNAWNLHDDLGTARMLFPEAPIIAVNGAAEQVQAFALFSLHPEKMWTHFAPRQVDLFGDRFTTHTGGRPEEKRRRADIDYYWPDAGGRGTSSWGAAKMARMMGFDQVILCGAPLEPGQYSDRKPARAFMRKHLHDYRDYIAEDRDWHEGVHSMSGWTRLLLGGPDGTA